MGAVGTAVVVTPIRWGVKLFFFFCGGGTDDVSDFVYFLYDVVVTLFWSLTADGKRHAVFFLETTSHR